MRVLTLAGRVARLLSSQANDNTMPAAKTRIKAQKAHQDGLAAPALLKADASDVKDEFDEPFRKRAHAGVSAMGYAPCCMPCMPLKKSKPKQAMD
jgi:hypothetical protein